MWSRGRQLPLGSKHTDCGLLLETRGVGILLGGRSLEAGREDQSVTLLGSCGVSWQPRERRRSFASALGSPFLAEGRVLDLSGKLEASFWLPRFSGGCLSTGGSLFSAAVLPTGLGSKLACVRGGRREAAPAIRGLAVAFDPWCDPSPSSSWTTSVRSKASIARWSAQTTSRSVSEASRSATADSSLSR